MSSEYYIRLEGVPYDENTRKLILEVYEDSDRRLLINKEICIMDNESAG